MTRTPFAFAGLLVAGVVGMTGCGAQFVVHGRPALPFDVAIVPGCPNEEGGALSRCQMGRALWAAELWHRGDAHAFITSGAAAYTPFVEAEGLAEAMVALGVPAERVYLEPNALHTDENIYFSLQIARALGFRRIAVASNRPQAASGCLMLRDWGYVGCAALAFDEAAVDALHRSRPGVLERIRALPVDGWRTIAEREGEIARRTRHARRMPSWLLYPYLGLLRITGNGPYIPANAPRRPPIVTWEAVLRARAATDGTR